MFEKIYYYECGKRRGPVSESKYLKLLKSGKVSINDTYTIGGELYFASDLAFRKLPREEFKKLSNKADKHRDNADDRLADLFEIRSAANPWRKFR